MKIRLTAVAVTLALMSHQASAQPGYAPGYGLISPRHVVATVRAAGLRPVAPPVRRGRNYLVHAVDGYGMVQRVFVDAEFGDIVRVVAARRGPGYPYVDRRPRYDDDDDLVIRPRTPFGAAPPEYSPPRPRVAIPQRLPPRGLGDDLADPDDVTAIVPPPPPPRRKAARPAAPKDTTRNAAATPGDKPAAAKPSTSDRKATGQKTSAAPRVILPGGPTPKGEAAAAPAAQPQPAAAAPVAPAPGASDIPPAQSLE